MFHSPKHQVKDDANKTVTLPGPTSGKLVLPSTSVRRSIGEWETGKPDHSRASLTLTKTSTEASPVQSPLAASKPSVMVTVSPPRPTNSKFSGRLAEAKAQLVKGKQYVNSSRNLRTDIKTGVLSVLDRLYQIIKESEPSSSKAPSKPQSGQAERNDSGGQGLTERLLGEHMALLRENSELSRQLKETLTHTSAECFQRSEAHAVSQTESMEMLLGEVRELRQATESRTYASVTAGAATTPQPAHFGQELHSVLVSSTDVDDTGEHVLNKIRKAVNAKEDGVCIENVRKAKDAKVIVACRTKEERRRVEERLSKAKELTVEVVKNRDPLVVARSVFNYNSDEEVLKAIRKQNRMLFDSLSKDDDRIEIAYKKRARNEHTSHIVMRVSPKLWQAMTVAGALHIDLQKVKVEDQSPLVQCSMCLGYGHGRRFCREKVVRCSYCGDEGHLNARCSRIYTEVSEPPTCNNCVIADVDNVRHTAFSSECPIRKKWDALARSTVAYC